MDANIVIAAFLRDSTVRRIMTLSLIDLLAPEFLNEEIRHHLPILRRRSGLSRGASVELLSTLRGSVTFVPAEALLPHWERASRAMAPVDPADIADVAAALASRSDGVWSDDPHLKEQRAVACWTTKELLEALRSQGLKL